MVSQAGGGFRLNVLNPGGRDPEQHFGEGHDGSGEHAPVNYHAYAACTGGSFFRETARAIAAGDPILLLLRGDFRQAERALAKLRAAGVPVAVTLKETGSHQIAGQLRDRAKLSRFLKLVADADGCIGPTPEATELYQTIRRRDAGVAFVPTPYPMHDRRWNFARSLEERRGILVGTREWNVPSRNHSAALLAARRLSELTGENVTVYDFAGRTGARLLAELEFASGTLQVQTKRTGYSDYLTVMAQHKIVFQLDTSFVPGQVAGDALLCRVPCVGGNGAVERLAFPDLCGVARSMSELIEVAVKLCSDVTFYEKTVSAAEDRASEHLSFHRAAEQFGHLFGQISRRSRGSV
ncbi:MAG: hypothetical protein H0U88_10120 [Chthoniobacterales bacterium]|nr:hypothetical protein [Chthoniobacterales bacterium]